MTKRASWWGSGLSGKTSYNPEKYLLRIDVVMSMDVGPVAALGIFDGVHLGHQKILEQTVLRARQLKTEALVLTFHPHPQVVLGGEGPKLITTLEDRQALIRGCGIHRVLVESFIPSFAQLTPEEFFTEVIVGKLQVREIVVGYDYTFGQGGAGNVETLRTLGQAQGIQVHRVSPVEIAGRKCPAPDPGTGDPGTGGEGQNPAGPALFPPGEGDPRGRPGPAVASAHGQSCGFRGDPLADGWGLPCHRGDVCRGGASCDCEYRNQAYL